MATERNAEQHSHVERDEAPQGWFRQALASKRLMFVVLVGVLLLAVRWGLAYQRDRALEQRLLGTWTYPGYAEDGEPPPTFFWKFLPNGTVNVYVAGQAVPDPTPEDAEFFWKISGGKLVVTYDHEFRPGQSLKSRFRVVDRQIREWYRGSRLPIYYADRCIVELSNHDNTVELTVDPDYQPAGGFMADSSVMQRVTDEDAE